MVGLPSFRILSIFHDQCSGQYYGVTKVGAYFKLSWLYAVMWLPIPWNANIGILFPNINWQTPGSVHLVGRSALACTKKKIVHWQLNVADRMNCTLEQLYVKICINYLRLSGLKEQYSFLLTPKVFFVNHTQQVYLGHWQGKGQHQKLRNGVGVQINWFATIVEKYKIFKDLKSF